MLGRFPEILDGVSSVDLVMAEVSQPAGGWECGDPEETPITDAITLYNLYTDRSKAQEGCVLPTGFQRVWYGSYFSGEGPKSEYTITLGYDTKDVNALPKKDSPELKQVFSDVRAMLETLRIKAPMSISKVVPDTAPPGATVTIYGSGFQMPGGNVAVRFRQLPNLFMLAPKVAEDGTSLAFQVPTAMQKISCGEGKIELWEHCVPIPEDHVDIDDCPRVAGQRSNFCGAPLPAAAYDIQIVLEGSIVKTDAARFTVAAPTPNPVWISLLYPSQLVRPGTEITVRGSGFTPTGNTITIGTAVVDNVASPDGKHLSFAIPAPQGISLYGHLKRFEAQVSNANGTSNSIIVDYR